MNILHYTIGLPPYRHGGSIQYANDLIQEQSKNNNVFALTCGDTLFKPSKVIIKFKYQKDNIKVYSLENPITPTLIYGTSNPKSQHKSLKIDYNNIKRFIEDNNIEVLHMHTLMGMHQDIIKYIKHLGVKIFYTTHDFHGICPHYNLLDYEGNLCHSVSSIRCAICNLQEPSEIFLKLVNSSLFQKLKSRGILNTFIKSKPHFIHQKEICLSSKDYEKAQKKSEEYDDLIEYYKEYLSLFDKIHFNSQQTKDIITSFIPSAKGEVVNVITSGIKDKRRLVSPSQTIALGFIGSLNDYKGFPILKRAIVELKNENINNLFIKVYGNDKVGIDEECNNIEYYPSYKYDELSDILYNLDGVIVPSKWYETFSLVTLESLAHGRPVFVSDHVGAKDIVAQYYPKGIFSTPEQLKTLLRQISSDTSILTEYSHLILENPWPFSIKNHVSDMLKFYKIDNHE
ncbi:MAG: glycosyltransferase [Muribaculaceae bacterium]|nr:glycosyltransferase [Muribaculaceae bacterium]